MPGTKERLLSLVEDIELVSRELIDNTLASKDQKLSAADYNQLTELIIMKDNELKSTLATAVEQGDIHKKMISLQSEVDKQDQEIKLLQKQLKEAEQLLATAIYQAKQKLNSINRANEHPISSEDLIKYSHQISATNAVAAPMSWQQGDPRRPYPTDIEMRSGFLGHHSDSTGLTSNVLLQPANPQELHRQGTHAETHSLSGLFSWHSSTSVETGIHPSVTTSSSGTIDGKRQSKEAEDVEVMSTDSSSSSSSDSQ